jgi:hypothetical protein
MSDLAEFLRARYTEDRQEEEGRRTLPANMHEVEFLWEGGEGYVLLGGIHRVDAAEFWKLNGIPGPDPDVLADLDAKLAIVDLHAGPHECSSYDAISREINACQWVPGGDCTTLRLLAKPFGEHRDYKVEEWAV